MNFNNSVLLMIILYLGKEVFKRRTGRGAVSLNVIFET